MVNFFSFDYCFLNRKVNFPITYVLCSLPVQWRTQLDLLRARCREWLWPVPRERRQRQQSTSVAHGTAWATGGATDRASRRGHGSRLGSTRTRQGNDQYTY